MILEWNLKRNLLWRVLLTSLQRWKWNGQAEEYKLLSSWDNNNILCILQTRLTRTPYFSTWIWLFSIQKSQCYNCDLFYQITLYKLLFHFSDCRNYQRPFNKQSNIQLKLNNQQSSHCIDTINFNGLFTFKLKIIFNLSWDSQDKFLEFQSDCDFRNPVIVIALMGFVIKIKWLLVSFNRLQLSR